MRQPAEETSSCRDLWGFKNRQTGSVSGGRLPTGRYLVSARGFLQGHGGGSPRCDGDNHRPLLFRIQHFSTCLPALQEKGQDILQVGVGAVGLETSVIGGGLRRTVRA